MKTLKTKGETRPVEPEQESYGVCCIKNEWEELFQHFFEYLHGTGKAAGTIHNYDTALTRFMKYLEKTGMVRVESVTPKHLSRFQAWFFSSEGSHGARYSITTQIGGLNRLQMFFRYLEKTGRIAVDPSTVLQLPRGPRRLPATLLTVNEIRKLLRQPDTATVLGFRDRTMYEVLYSSGLRVGELTRLRVQDFDLNDSTLFILSNKRSYDRLVPLGKTARRFLIEYLEKVRPLLLRKNSGDHVFIGRRGSILDDTGVQLKLRIYAERAGIKKRLTVHVFRHTLATEMLRRGADIRHVQELLGHLSLKTTQIYTHITKKELKRVQSKCHPREQSSLPAAVFRYRGRNYLTDEEKKSEQRTRG